MNYFIRLNRGCNSQPPPRPKHKTTAATLLTAAFGLLGTAIAQVPVADIETDALRYSMTRTEMTVFASGTDYGDLDIGHHVRAIHGPAQTTTYLALRGQDGETAVTMTYPKDEAGMPQSNMRLPGRTVMTTLEVTVYDRDGAFFYEVPVTDADSAFLYEYNFSLMRVETMRAMEAQRIGEGAKRIAAKESGAGIGELGMERTYEFDAEHLVSTTTELNQGVTVSRSTTVYQEVDAPGGAVVFPLFTALVEPFDEGGVRGSDVRTLNYSAPEWGERLRSRLAAEAEGDSGTQLVVGPNPSTSFVRIVEGVDLSAPGKTVTVEIYGVDGRRYSRASGVSPTQPIDVSALPAGVYVLRVVDGAASLTTTIAKQ